MKLPLLIPVVLLTVACASESKKSSTAPESHNLDTMPIMIPQPMVFYRDSAGVTLQVFHFISEPEKIRVTAPDGSNQFLLQAESASGVRYTNPEGYEFWEHQGEGSYSIGDSTIFVGPMR